MREDPLLPYLRRTFKLGNLEMSLFLTSFTISSRLIVGSRRANSVSFGEI